MTSNSTSPMIASMSIAARRATSSAEWMPLYIAYANTGNTEQINEVAASLRSEPGLVDNYCHAMVEKSTSTDEYYIYNLCPEELEYQK